ncbi:MAG: sigma-70 family RNA polymerase sigma factor [Lewinellaceae bacterium]|jgi:RNA polymerase sigma factor (sigma-70 family)|nr:sigma-70 family RNA polymerase sigma factor [Lewinellaceae bacterium]
MSEASNSDLSPEPQRPEIAFCGKESVQALTPVFTQYHGKCLALAAGITGSPEEAKDVVAKVFAKALLRWEVFARAENLRGYLHRTIRNESLKVIDGNQKSPIVPISNADQLTDDTLETTLNAMIDGKRLFKLLPTVLSPDSLAVVLLWLEDFSHAEIALELGISETASRQRLSRAIKELRNIFNPDDDGGGNGRKRKTNKKSSGIDELNSSEENLQEFNYSAFWDPGQIPGEILFKVFSNYAHWPEPSLEDIVQCVSNKNKSGSLLFRLNVLKWIITDAFTYETYLGVCLLLKRFDQVELLQYINSSKSDFLNRIFFKPLHRANNEN